MGVWNENISIFVFVLALVIPENPDLNSKCSF